MDSSVSPERNPNPNFRRQCIEYAHAEFNIPETVGAIYFKELFDAVVISWDNGSSSYLSENHFSFRKFSDYSFAIKLLQVSYFSKPMLALYHEI